MSSWISENGWIGRFAVSFESLGISLACCTNPPNYWPLVYSSLSGSAAYYMGAVLTRWQVFIGQYKAGTLCKIGEVDVANNRRQGKIAGNQRDSQRKHSNTCLRSPGCISESKIWSIFRLTRLPNTQKIQREAIEYRDVLIIRVACHETSLRLSHSSISSSCNSSAKAFIDMRLILLTSPGDCLFRLRNHHRRLRAISLKLLPMDIPSAILNPVNRVLYTLTLTIVMTSYLRNPKIVLKRQATNSTVYMKRLNPCRKSLRSCSGGE